MATFPIVTAEYNSATGAAGGSITLSNGASIDISSAGYANKIEVLKANNPGLVNEINAATAKFDALAAKAIADANPPTPAEVPVFKQSEINKPIRVENAPIPVEKTPTPPAPSSSSKPDDDNNKNNQKTEKKAAVEATPGTGTGLPNSRPYNPLGDFSSYTYQLSLYMVTPEAANRFIMSGEAQVGNSLGSDGQSSDGFYLVAQSGGINNASGNEIGGNKRAPGFDLDFYIDDLKFKTQTTTKMTQSASPANIDFEFNIYEPYGLSFTSKLATAAKNIQAQTALPGFEGAPNALAQFFCVGIRFYGYDKNGEIVTANKYVGADSKRSDSQTLFERFYTIKIKSFKFRLDGRTPVYNITAAPLSLQEGLGNKRAQLPLSGTISGSTVDEMLNGKRSLVSQLNEYETKLAATRKKEADKKKTKDVILANKYKIVFDENSGIGDALMVDPKDFAKYKLNISMGGVENTKDSNPKAEGKASTNKGMKSFAISSGTHIIATIEQVIKQSSYIKDMMNVVNSALSEEESAENGNPAEVAWFSIVPGIKILGKDTMLNDYAYEITYYIQKYKVPFIRTALVSKTSAYPGPHKKYEYWYTGNNKEVISYEQTYNNLYFLTGVSANGNDSSPNVPKVDKPQPGNQSGSQNKSAEAVNALAVDLYDPGSQVNSKMSILGDPDYLAQNVGASMNDIFSKFYGNDNFTINPAGGQVFVELDFKTAVDYDSAGSATTPAGTLSINDKIRFYDYDPSIRDAIPGITFELKWVTSTFSKGKFTQDLDLYPTSLSDFARKPKDKANRGESGGRKTASGGTIKTLDANKAKKARKEFAAQDPRRIDLPQNKNNDTNPYSVNNQTSKTRNTLQGLTKTDKTPQGIDDDRTSSGNSRGYNKSSEVYQRDMKEIDPVTLLPKRK